MERAKGVEPSTFSLATRRSTTELCPLVLISIENRSFLINYQERNIFKLIKIYFKKLFLIYIYIVEINEKFKKIIYHYKKNDFEKAEKLLNDQIDNIENKFLFYKIFSSIYLKQSKWEKFIDSNIRLTEFDQEKTKALCNIGIGNFQLGKISKAINYFQLSIKQNYNYEIALENLAICYKEIGAFKESIKYFLEVIKLNKHNRKSVSLLIDLMKYDVSKFSNNSNLLKINQNIINLNDQINHKKLNTNILRKVIQKSIDYIKSYENNINYNELQIYRINKKNLNCERHFKVFNKYQIIPKFCFGCYKVQVTTTNVVELIKLYFLFNENFLNENPLRKCMVETRKKVKGNYKGYIYTQSLHDAENTLKIVNKKILSNNIKIESIEIKHGCSEYYEKYPKYKNFRDQNMSYDKNWLKFEKSIDNEILSRSKEDEKYIGITINKINLSDILIIINWLKYAKNIGDKTYLKILDN